jgi:hypothetical protein
MLLACGAVAIERLPLFVHHVVRTGCNFTVWSDGNESSLHVNVLLSLLLSPGSARASVCSSMVGVTRTPGRQFKRLFGVAAAAGLGSNSRLQAQHVSSSGAWKLSVTLRRSVYVHCYHRNRHVGHV